LTVDRPPRVHVGFFAAIAFCLFFANGENPAHAQTKLEASYVATLAGVPIGRGVWILELTPDQFIAAASGRTTGLLQVLAGGRGTAVAKGSISPGRSPTANYEASIVTEKNVNAVKVAISDGVVREFSAEPPSSPHPDRVPIADSHRRGVLDPMSAALMAVVGNGDILSPEACNRTLPVFDGRGRFDLALSFKRIDRVKAAKGYQGPTVVCAVNYRPISGHRPSQSAVKYLMRATEIEVWLAPVDGTRIVVPFRASVPTVLGPAVVEATQFTASSRAARTTPATLQTE
jgi:hypothetical protein